MWMSLCYDASHQMRACLSLGSMWSGKLSMDRYAENRQRQIYDIATQKLRVQTRNRSIISNRSILFMGLLLSMLTMGLLAIVLAPAFTTSAFPQAKQRQGGTRVATATMAPSPTATPSPTPMPSPTPTVQPVEPWPSTLDAQIATLKAHNRFFYQGNSALPEIALTFDDGPDSTYTPQVLAILKAYHVPATFLPSEVWSRAILLLSGRRLLTGMQLAIIAGLILICRAFQQAKSSHRFRGPLISLNRSLADAPSTSVRPMAM